jgi:hypothetical protein
LSVPEVVRSQVGAGALQDVTVQQAAPVRLQVPPQLSVP